MLSRKLQARTNLGLHRFGGSAATPWSLRKQRRISNKASPWATAILICCGYSIYCSIKGRAAEVADLLKNETRADGLLLRLAIAESMLTPKPDSLNAHVATLQA